MVKNVEIRQKMRKFYYIHKEVNNFDTRKVMVGLLVKVRQFWFNFDIFAHFGIIASCYKRQICPMNKLFRKYQLTCLIWLCFISLRLGLFNRAFFYLSQFCHATIQSWLNYWQNPSLLLKKGRNWVVFAQKLIDPEKSGHFLTLVLIGLLMNVA